MVFQFKSDGVGDGQLKTVKDYELAQLKQACANISAEFNPLFTMVVVQKRINARFYVTKPGPENQVDNPAPGSVVDHTITRRGLCDFKRMNELFIIYYNEFLLSFRSI